MVQCASDTKPFHVVGWGKSERQSRAEKLTYVSSKAVDNPLLLVPIRSMANEAIMHQKFSFQLQAQEKPMSGKVNVSKAILVFSKRNTLLGQYWSPENLFFSSAISESRGNTEVNIF